MSTAGLSMGLSDLPDDCIALTLSFLESPRDVLVFEATCKRFWAIGRASEVWAARLKRHFDLRVQATTGEQGSLDLQKLYASTASTSPDRLLRFTGVFTDGGCDNNMAQYWVDNLFTANHWHSFCSALGKNINCVGMLMEPEPHAHWPDQERHHRNYMISRCLLPHGLLTRTIQRAGGPLGIDPAESDREREFLDRLSTSELEHLLAELFAEYQQRTSIGRLLFYGVASLDAEVDRVEGIVRDMVQGAGRTLKQMGISGGHREMDVLMDGRSLQRLAADEHKARYAGVMEGLTINRQGNFSCPVSTGVIFVANLPTPDTPASAFEEAANHFAALLSSQSCTQFNYVNGGRQLFDLSHQGQLPPIISSGRNHAGKWVEFDPDWRHPDDATAGDGLRPVAWFQFWNRPEAYSFVKVMAEMGRDPVTGAHQREWDSWEVRKTCFRLNLSRIGVFAHEMLRKPWDEPMELGQEFLRWEYLAREFPPPDDLQEVGTYEGNFITELDNNGVPAIKDPRLNINKLDIQLSRQRAGNVAVVKLIDQEDLMEEWMDTHDEPNIDATFIAFKGRQLFLPPGVQLAC